MSSRSGKSSPGVANTLAEFFAHLDRCSGKNSHTHGIHPYPAKFIPHIPRELIAAYAPPGGIVWDPMCGSGTSLLEAQLAGRRAVGTDLNPIAALVSRVKTMSLAQDAEAELDDLGARLDREPSSLGDYRLGDAPTFRNRDKWFHPVAITELTGLRAAVNALATSQARDVGRCVLSAIVVPASNQESETRWCARPRDVAPGEVVALFARRLRSTTEALRLLGMLNLPPAEVRCADARASGLGTESVDFVVTSPPYANAHDYYLYNKLRMFWLGYDVTAVQDAEIGSRNKHSDRKHGIAQYLDDMGSALAEVARVLRPGGAAVVVVADAIVRGEFHDMGRMFPGVARDFTLEATYGFQHQAFNAAFQRGFGTRQTKTTHVLVMRRCGARALGGPRSQPSRSVRAHSRG